MHELESLLIGNTKETTRSLRNIFELKPANPSIAIQVCSCYFWQGLWTEARECADMYLNKSIEHNRTSDVAYKLLGTSAWCAGEYSQAIDDWREGLDVAYADMGGGITVPLHLYFASVLEPTLIDREEVVDILTNRLHAKPHKGWPGYLVKILLVELSIEDAIIQAKEDVSHLRDEEYSQAVMWATQEIEFWVGIRSLQDGNMDDALAHLSHVSKLTLEDLNDNLLSSINKFRSTILYLARHELGRLPSRTEA